MYLLGRPSAASNTMRLRNTTRCAVVPARSQRSSVARCSGVSGKAGARFMPSTVPKPGRKYKAIGDHCTREAFLQRCVDRDLHAAAAVCRARSAQPSDVEGVGRHDPPILGHRHDLGECEECANRHPHQVAQVIDRHTKITLSAVESPQDDLSQHGRSIHATIGLECGGTANGASLAGSNAHRGWCSS